MFRSRKFPAHHRDRLVFNIPDYLKQFLLTFIVSFLFLLSLMSPKVFAQPHRLRCRSLFQCSSWHVCIQHVLAFSHFSFKFLLLDNVLIPGTISWEWCWIALCNPCPLVEILFFLVLLFAQYRHIVFWFSAASSL